jgi:hypothetical protein
MLAGHFIQQDLERFFRKQLAACHRGSFKWWPLAKRGGAVP